MSVIHRTTMSPTKLELLASWLPARPWYAGHGGAPDLGRVGGFRLDDPEGEVGIEFMAVTDAGGDEPRTYHVPLSYRGAPLDGADDALIGTCEHGVLGRRWIYDGTQDPVLVAQLAALVAGRAEPQQQSISDTPDPTVLVDHEGPAADAADLAAVTVSEDEHGTVIALGGKLTLRVNRLLQNGSPEAGPGVRGHVTAGWRLADGGEARGRYVVVQEPDGR